jgi:hypothetical protein
MINTAILASAMVFPALQIPCFAQQEVDPTWHDPWAVTAPTQPSHTVATTNKPKAQAPKAHRQDASAKPAHKANPPANAHVETVTAKDAGTAGNL